MKGLAPDLNSVRSLEETRCRFCDSQAQHAFSAYEGLNRVTSDCRPWRAGGRLQVCEDCGLLQKPADRSFVEDAREIYRNYAVYYQGDGQEQKVFGSESAWSRSACSVATLASCTGGRSIEPRVRLLPSVFVNCFPNVRK